MSGRIRSLASALLATALLSACASAPKSATAPARPAGGILTQEEAALRSRLVSRPNYVLWFGLDAVGEEFEGRTVITFDLKPKAKELSKTLFLEFEGGPIRSLSLNGVHKEPLTPEIYNGQRLVFKTAELAPGANRIEIAYTRAYSREGNGLHRFKDPVDGRVYVYSNFEPYAAHKMFPCFDQPDLKASFELTVETPQDWEVIANTLERDSPKVDGKRSWHFPPSPVFSSYVFALHAGPFAVWRSNAEGIALRLFARQSLAQHVDPPEWFEVTAKGLDYFSVQFGYPYPYSKYDQVIVPEFNAGAMENVAAVTFSERMIFRTKPTLDQRRRRADTILHEMAHMWFGDLVTMKWWNGLWLNESFATYMAAKAAAASAKFPGIWPGFFGTKQWAYWEDQLVTTHPIEVPVNDTEFAKANFDGITYGKGAAALKQLEHFLGEDDFREGIQRYFLKYALKSVTTGEFFKILSEASGRDLGAWQRSWVQSPGINTLQARWACEENAKGQKVLSQFALLQGNAENSAQLRPHRTRVALYGGPKGAPKGAPGQAWVAYETADVTYSQAETPVEALIGKRCPELVYPNHEDHDYVKAELDPASIAAAKERLSRIQDPFARRMIWHSLWQMVVDAKLPAQEYAELVFAHGKRETDPQILPRLLESLFNSSPGRASVAKYLPGEKFAAFRDRLETMLLKQLTEAPAGSDLQIAWFESLVDVVSEKPMLDFLHSLLSGKNLRLIRGLKVDQERRWQVIGALARNAYPDPIAARALIAEELKKDPTDNGTRSALSAEAALPDPESKKTWLSRILNPAMEAGENAGAFNPSKLRAAMGSFHSLGTPELTRQSVDAYFENLPRLSATAGTEYAARFASSLYPSLCDPAIIERVGALLKTELPAPVARSLRIARQEDERCIRARARSAQ